MEKMIFDFDPSKCTACQACVMACFDQNDIDVLHGQHPFRNAAELEAMDKGKAPLQLPVGGLYALRRRALRHGLPLRLPV